jgi:hypothetical protein
MADYSGYTIKRTHALAPLTSVHEAVAADGRPGRFALKIFHPPPSTNLKRAYAIEGWLIAAEAQQRSAKKDGSVVEVLAFGRCEEGAYAVMPWQENPLEPWIKTLTPKGDTLRALAECLLNTLEKWEAQTGAPHGNLKPANIFLDRKGPLVGMTAKLSDPAFLPGAKPEALRLADFAAIGATLAHIVRRRPPGTWPIEDAPEWKGLGPGGKGWLDFCNFLLNPSPKEGEITLAEARKHLRKVPKDANPVRTAVLTLAAVVVLGAISTVAFARFGNPIYMPDQIYRLAQTLKNPQIKPEVPIAWTRLCNAWDTWLISLQSNGPRLLRTTALWEQDDALRTAITDFLATANELQPAALVPQAAGEKRLGLLASSPPPEVLNELQVPGTAARVADAGARLQRLSIRLEAWARWNQLRALQQRMEQRNYSRTASALQGRLPPRPGSAGYKLDLGRTLQFLNDLSLDTNGALLLAGRWGEITQLSADMEASGDRIQREMPRIILDQLQDSASLSTFAESLAGPLDEFRLRRQQFTDPQVVRERFLKESSLQTAEKPVERADFEAWEKELHAFSLVPRAEDPRLAPAIDATGTRLTQGAADLEDDAPAAPPGGLATLTRADFQREYETLAAGLRSLRERPIVRRDLPGVADETTKMGAAYDLLEQRLKVTIELLRPEVWLAKVADGYGKFEETKRRWVAWQATIANVTADALRGDRPRFRQLRAQERQVKEWIDGVEGPTGFAALVVPELTASPDTAAELQRLEAILRERAVAAVAGAAVWANALPAAPWASASDAVRAPLESHRAWLAHLGEFATDLDRLHELLLAGFGWTEEVGDVAGRLARVTGVGDLNGAPAQWYADARQLERLVNNRDRSVLTAAAQSGGLSHRLMAWRGLGALAGWPAGPADFDLDTGVVGELRGFVGRDVKDDARRTTLLDEFVRETRLRFNRAARAAARAESELGAMFDRMQPVGITAADLDAPVAYNLALYRLKHEDWNETNLGLLGARRDRFVQAVRAIRDLPEQADVTRLMREISSIELVDDPNRPPTPSPRMAGWAEEMSNEGLTLTATKQLGAKAVKLEYHVVQAEGVTPFYLASRAIAVGEFVDLMNVPSAQVNAVLDALPQWVTRSTSFDKPYNEPVAWGPRGTGRGVELNDGWILFPDTQVKGVLETSEVRANRPALAKAVEEKPSSRTPLQQLPPEAAKIFAEQVLGARLPTPEEWRAVARRAGRPPENSLFRGPSFRELWQTVESYREGGQELRWRPNAGIFLPSVKVEGSNVRQRFIDKGEAVATEDRGRIWLSSVDDGPSTDGFINLFGNVWIYLYDAASNTTYVAGGSALSPPGVDVMEPHKVEPVGLIGATRVREGFSDVGIRPAFYAPPGFRERYKLFVLVREQRYLTL